MALDMMYLSTFNPSDLMRVAEALRLKEDYSRILKRLHWNITKNNSLEEDDDVLTDLLKKSFDDYEDVYKKGIALNEKITKFHTTTVVEFHCFLDLLYNSKDPSKRSLRRQALSEMLKSRQVLLLEYSFLDQQVKKIEMKYKYSKLKDDVIPVRKQKNRIAKFLRMQQDFLEEVYQTHELDSE